MSNYGYFVIFHSISTSHLVIGVFHQWLHGRFTPKWPSIQWRKCGKMTALKHDEIEWGSFRILRQSIWWDVAITCHGPCSLVAVGNPNFRGRGSFFCLKNTCFLWLNRHFDHVFLVNSSILPGPFETSSCADNLFSRDSASLRYQLQDGSENMGSWGVSNHSFVNSDISSGKLT